MRLATDAYGMLFAVAIALVQAIQARFVQGVDYEHDVAMLLSHRQAVIERQ